KEHSKLLVDSVLKGPFKYVTVRDKTYDELTDAENIHESSDIKATNIIILVLPKDIYNLVNHHKEAKDIWDRVKLLIDGSKISLQERESKLYDEFNTFTSVLGETIHLYYLSLNGATPNVHQPSVVQQQFYQPSETRHSSMVHHQSYQTPVIHQPPQPSFPPMNSGLAVPSFLPSDDLIANGLGETGTEHVRQRLFVATTVKRKTTWQDSAPNLKGLGIQHAIFQTDDLDAFNSDCDEAPSPSTVLMAKLSAYDSDVLSEVPTHDTYLDNQVIDQSVQEMQYSEQPVFINDSNIDITSDSNMISYEQYLKETENAVVQDTPTPAQQDTMIMSVIEDMSNQVTECKKKYKAKEDEYLEEIIGLEKKKKALDNVVYKMGQSTQTMHMLTKPQVFYDESHKTTLGYQNPLYLTQAQRKVPALYCGRTIVKQHDALSVTDTEKTLELAEESRLKMHAKQNDPITKEKKVNIAPIDYATLNKLSVHFVSHFVPQKQLYAE
ncbi:hypothetical protein Tco_1157727, partial [Tanacetum coccineum]